MNSKKLSELLFKKKFVSNETQDESKRHEDSDDKSQESEKKKIKVKQEINNMVLTIDVGLKNLAMCIMDSHYNIHLWDVYNILIHVVHVKKMVKCVKRNVNLNFQKR